MLASKNTKHLDKFNTATTNLNFDKSEFKDAKVKSLLAKKHKMYSLHLFFWSYSFPL